MVEIFRKRLLKTRNKVTVRLNETSMKVNEGDQLYIYRFKDLKTSYDFSHSPNYHLLVLTADHFVFLFTNCERACNHVPIHHQFSILLRSNFSFHRILCHNNPGVILNLFK